MLFLATGRWSPAIDTTILIDEPYARRVYAPYGPTLRFSSFDALGVTFIRRFSILYREGKECFCAY